MRDCAVRAVDVSGTTVLAAYIIRRQAQAWPESLGPQGSVVAAPARRFEPEWRAYAAARLPEYMVPSIWVEVDHVPLTPTGKVDRRQFPEPPTSRPATRVPFARPRTPTQRRIASLWTQVLGLDSVGLDDGFFELGGSSLLATAVVAALRSEFGLALPTSEAYQHPTVRSLAQFIDGEFDGSARVIRAERSGETDHVAVVGIGCRFPGASTHAQFWSNLVQGVDSISRQVELRR